MLQLLVLLAEDAPKPTTTGAPAFDFFVPLLFMGVLFYLLMVRPMQKERRERQALLATVKKNDKVLTNAGIYGTVVAVSDKEDEITVRVDDNCRLKMTKGSILRNLTNEEIARAAKAGPPPKEGS